ncbi:MAG: hypothetical protein ACFHU9_12190 [Fluviicola sp.]
MALKNSVIEKKIRKNALILNRRKKEFVGLISLVLGVWLAGMAFAPNVRIVFFVLAGIL